MWPASTPSCSPRFVRQKGLNPRGLRYSAPACRLCQIASIAHSPFYFHQKLAGAHFVEANGWERPCGWMKSAALVKKPIWLFRKSRWDTRVLPIAVAEAWATRNRVAIRHDIVDALPCGRSGCHRPLERLTTNTVSKHPARSPIHHAGCHRRDSVRHHRYPSDGTRIPDRRHNHRDLIHLKIIFNPRNMSPSLISPGTCCIGLGAPRARCAEQTDRRRHQPRRLGYSAKQSTLPAFQSWRCEPYVGELGWELYTTADHGARLWKKPRRDENTDRSLVDGSHSMHYA